VPDEEIRIVVQRALQLLRERLITLGLRVLWEVCWRMQRSIKRLRLPRGGDTGMYEST